MACVGGLEFITMRRFFRTAADDHRRGEGKRWSSQQNARQHPARRAVRMPPLLALLAFRKNGIWVTVYC